MSDDTKDSCPLCLSRNVLPNYRRGPDRFHGRPRVYELMRCRACSLVWTHNPPRPEELSNHYGSAYHEAITTAGDTSPDRWLRRRDVVLRHKSYGAILDIGCSSGAFLDTLKGHAWQLSGIEINSDVAAQAATRTGARVFAGDAAQAPFGPDSFDVVTCFHVLEHHHQPMDMVTAVRKWLRPDGILYLALPNVDSWEARLFGSYWYGLELPRHLFHFSPHLLRQLMSEAGFHTLSLETPTVSYFESSVRYLVDDVLGQLGLPRQPLAQAGAPGVPWRIIRKAFRLTFLLSFSQLARMAGMGASIEAVFQK